MAQAVDSSNVVDLALKSRIPAAFRRKTPNARLETCELAGLRALGRFVILDPDLFGLAAGYQSTQAHRGLERLFEKGLADRGYYVTERTEEEVALSLPTTPQGLAYKLTADGIKRGRREGVIDASAPLIRRRWRGSAPPDMKHRLLIVEMMVQTRLDIARQERLAVGRTIFDFVRVDGNRATKDEIFDGRSLAPDLIFELEEFFGDESTLLFCEVENSKLQPSSKDKDQETVATKIKKYGDYFRSPKRKFRGATQDILLYIQNHPPAHLDEVIKSVPWAQVGDVRKLLRLTTFEDIRQHGVLNGLWRDWRGETVRLVG